MKIKIKKDIILVWVNEGLGNRKRVAKLLQNPQHDKLTYLAVLIIAVDLNYFPRKLTGVIIT